MTVPRVRDVTPAPRSSSATPPDAEQLTHDPSGAVAGLLRGGLDALGPAGPLEARWRRGVVLLGTVCAAAVTLGMLPELHSGPSMTTWVLAAGVGLWVLELYAVPANRALEAALLLGVGVAGAVLNATTPQSPGFVLAFFAVAGLGIRFPARPAAVLTAAVIAAVDVGIAATSAHVATSVITSDLGLAFVFVVAAATRAARAADARSTLLLAELEQSRAAQEAAATVAERTRLAREIHDILAHSLSGQIMSLEATRMLAERTNADARVVSGIDRAHRLAKDGLGDTRRAIEALRGDALPGPERLPELVEEAQGAHGVRATLTVQGEARALAADAGLSLYRTAQEALTNTAKYAGRGAAAHLLLRWEQDLVHLEVTDTRRPGSKNTPDTGATAQTMDPADTADTADVAGAAATSGRPPEPLPSGGYGLTGLRERAELAGGSLDAGPTPEGFRVTLTLPTLATPPRTGEPR